MVGADRGVLASFREYPRLGYEPPGGEGERFNGVGGSLLDGAMPSVERGSYGCEMDRSLGEEEEP